MNTANAIPVKSHTAVEETISSARQKIGSEEYLAVSDCVDVLLDCYNASAHPEVKTVITELLPQFSVGNLRKADEFIRALDMVQIAALASETEIDLAEPSA